MKIKKEETLELTVSKRDEIHAAGKKFFSTAQSPLWVGRTVAYLLLDKNIERRAGRVIWCHDVS